MKKAFYFHLRFFLTIYWQGQSIDTDRTYSRAVPLLFPKEVFKIEGGLAAAKTTIKKQPSNYRYSICLLPTLHFMIALLVTNIDSGLVAQIINFDGKFKLLQHCWQNSNSYTFYRHSDSQLGI